MFYVYIIQDKNTNKNYTGQTNDLDRRINEHKKGRTQSIKKIADLKLVHVEILETREEAVRMEKYFKSGFGRENIKEIEEIMPEW